MSYPCIAKISLKNLKNNAISVKKLLKPKTKFYAVVKSNAYGHGIVEISNAIYDIVDGFAVSLISEAIKLRVSGIDKDILMLTPPFKETAYDLVRYNVTASVSSLSEIKLLESSAKKLSAVAKIQLALNTGMNRLGFTTVSQLKRVVAYIKKSEYLSLTGAFSHFGNVLNNAYVKSQFNIFKTLTDVIKKDYPKIEYHISSSGGVLLGKKYHLNACRVGLLLYGYKPFKTNKITVKPVMKVYAKKVCVRKGIIGKNLMYGDNLSTTDTATVLRLGYADGFLRKGQQNTINDLCMDISAIKGGNFKELVPIMLNAEVLSEKWDTIPYEVLVNATSRAEFRYRE